MNISREKIRVCFTMAKIGEIIDRYRIDEVIKQGGMSRVYKVMDLKLNTVWAMKEISIKDNDETVGLIESGIIKSAKHPSLPRITDIVRTEESYCIVMDYIEGTDLEDYVKRSGGLSEEETVFIGKEILKSLDYLHSRKQKIIYRDLKPSNVMITKNKEIKLIDFGISMREDEECIEGFLSRSFASPEQIAGGVTDERSDIYSLGVTLKFLLKKEPSLGFDMFLNKCTQKEPSERYQSARQALKAIDASVKLTDKQIKEMSRTVQRSIFAMIMLFLSVSGIFLSEIYKKNISLIEYEELIRNATENYDREVRITSLKSLLEKDPNEKWYLKLFDEIKADSVLSYEEASDLEMMLEKDAAILKEKGEYTTVSKELGRMYLFYFEDSDNEFEKYIRAARWFDENVRNGGSAYAYSETAHFLSDIQSMILEGRDGGMYKDYFFGLKKILTDDMTKEPTVRIKIMSLATDSILAYGTDFLREGILIEEMNEMLDEIDVFLSNEKDFGNEYENAKSDLRERIKKAREELVYIEGRSETIH